MKTTVLMKKFVIIVLALLLCAALCCVAATDIAKAETDEENAAFGGGSGTALSPYIISDAQDMIALMEGVNNITAPDGYFGKTFILSDDIDMTGIDIRPIGNFTYPFKGKIYGGGHSVSGIDILVEGEPYAGLFGVTSADAVIDGLALFGRVCGDAETGGLVGFNNGKINACVNNVHVSNIDDNTVSNIGGICGYNKGVITNCSNRSSVFGHGVNTGGIAGLNDSLGEISDCFNIGEIKSTFYDVGGIVGHNNGSVDGCFNSSQIAAYSTVGGIAGSNSGAIANAYNVGRILADNNMAGGICGSSDGDISKVFSKAEIVATSLKYGICGYATDGATFDACYLNSDSFSGRMTNRGDDFLNSARLDDRDMVLSDVLEENGAMAALRSVSDKWTKREFDEKCYMPQLTVFSDSAQEEIRTLSQTSAAIERRFVDDAELETTRYTYNGQANVPEVSSKNAKYIRDVDYQIVCEDNVNVGTAKAEIAFINYYKGDTSKSFAVEKRELSVEWREQEIIFNGEIQHPFVEITDGRVGDEDVTFVYTGAGQAVGEYVVTAQLADSEVNANYSFDPVSIKYSITTSRIQLSWDESQLIYNGLAQYPKATVTGGAFDDVSIEYFGYQANVNANSNYTVTATVNNSNYSLNETHKYGISKKEIFADFEDVEFVYNGKAQYPKIANAKGVISGEEVEFLYSGYENNIAAGRHTVIARLAENAVNSNYLFASKECAYSIDKKQLGVKCLQEQLIYNGKAQYPKFSPVGLVSGDSVDWIISDHSANIDASEGEAYAVIVDLQDGNYAFQPVEIRYDIMPMSITIAWDRQLIYNGQVQRPDAKILEDTPDEVVLTYSHFNGVNAGKGYGITVTPQSKNYVVGNVLTYDILPMLLNVVWSDSDFVYNGLAQYPNAAVECLADGTAVDFDYIKEESVKSGDYTIAVKLDDTNYDVVNGVLQYTIKQKLLQIDGLMAEDKAYDGSKDVVLSGGILIGLENNDDVDFVISDALTKSPNAGIWEVSYNVTLIGDNADCYRVEKPAVAANIKKAIFDTSQLIFQSKTFAFDGTEKFISVEGDVPDCLVIQYFGNYKTNVGEYIVTAKFKDVFGNFENIADMQATMYVANAVLADEENRVSVRADGAVLPYGAQLKISKSNDWSGKKGDKSVVGVYSISLMKDGEAVQLDCRFRIEKTLDKKYLSSKDFTVLQAVGDGYQEIEYEIEDGKLIFYVDSLCQFVVLAKTPQHWIWYVAAAILATVVVAAAVTATYIFTKKKKAQLNCQRANETVWEVVASADDVLPAAELVEVPFVVDGVECAGWESFLAALCYKDVAKQKEVAKLSAKQAWARANGKGGAKRREVYWQGKKIIRDSREYRDLIQRAGKSADKS